MPPSTLALLPMEHTPLHSAAKTGLLASKRCASYEVNQELPAHSTDWCATTTACLLIFVRCGARRELSLAVHLRAQATRSDAAALVSRRVKPSSPWHARRAARTRKRKLQLCPALWCCGKHPD